MICQLPAHRDPGHASWSCDLKLYSHDDSGWERSLRTAGLAVAGFDPCVLASQQFLRRNRSQRDDVWEQGDLNPHNVAVYGF